MRVSPVPALVAAVAVLCLVSTPVAAAAVEDAETTATDTPTPAHEVEDATETIDNHTSIVAARYDREAGEVTLVLESTTRQFVTVTDAGGVFKGGEINRRRAYLQPGRNRISLVVTEVNGNAAVTVDTGDTLYGIPVRRAGSNPLEQVAPTSAWVGGVTIAVSMFAFAAWREMKKEHGEPVSGWEAV